MQEKWNEAGHFKTYGSGNMILEESKQVDAKKHEEKREDFRNAFNALRDEASDIPDMTLEEINSEISDVREKHKN